jgi:hypothetical protein
MQIFFKGDWIDQPKKRQIFTSLYILLSPALQALMVIYIPVSVILALTIKMPVGITLFSFVPMLLLGLQISTLTVGLYEFTRAYNLKFPVYMPAKIILTYFPYQTLLAIAAFRAILRLSLNLNMWEKTSHINAHRESVKLAYAE